MDKLYHLYFCWKMNSRSDYALGENILIHGCASIENKMAKIFFHSLCHRIFQMYYSMNGNVRLENANRIWFVRFSSTLYTFVWIVWWITISFHHIMYFTKILRVTMMMIRMHFYHHHPCATFYLFLSSFPPFFNFFPSQYECISNFYRQFCSLTERWQE